MKISGNLEFYRKILDFENDTGKHELILGNLDRSQQRAIHSIADSRNLNYEHRHGYVRVLRNCATNWNIEVMIENSGAELIDYHEPIDSGRPLDEQSHSELDLFGSNTEVEPLLQFFSVPISTGIAQDNVASEGLPLAQPETGSQLDMPEYESVVIHQLSTESKWTSIHMSAKKLLSLQISAHQDLLGQ
ncbi:uncharacterized protein EAF01_001117 [Botrytis porri]|nr:uncharacterized protein EAF01_001117 [Botrytis porri]KAF7912096.1 hypothetical protein EAF01_001117 [Botrytis porri]